MLAVIIIGSKQYKVSKGDTLNVDGTLGKVGGTLTFDRVLLTSDGGKTRVGSPNVRGVKVTAKIIAHLKGKKIDVYRFKSKVRERRHIGFRPLLTKLEIVSIGKA